jgi:hypothetical protein
LYRIASHIQSTENLKTFSEIVQDFALPLKNPFITYYEIILLKNIVYEKNLVPGHSS